MCWIMAPMILRVSWKSFSSLQWEFRPDSSVAILLCNLRKTMCKDVRAGCSLSRPSPARKQVVDKEPRLHRSDSSFGSKGLRDCILPYCSKPRMIPTFTIEKRLSLSILFFFLFSSFKVKEMYTYRSGIFSSCRYAWHCCYKPWKRPRNWSLESIVLSDRIRSSL